MNHQSHHDELVTELRGIVPSLHTPFTADDQIDTASLRRLTEWTIESSCAGMLISAVAGETGSLTLAEKQLLMDTVLEQTNSRIPVIVGVSSAEQQDRLALARLAKAAGADWMLCQAPESADCDTLLRLFSELADVGPPKLMIQDLSWHTYGMAIDDIVRLFEHIPTFKALKIEVVPSGPKYSQVLEATGGRLHVSGGWAIMTMIETLLRGVHALIPSTMDPIYTRIYQLFTAGQEEQARHLFERILPVLAFTHEHLHVSIAFAKRLRVREGLFATDRCRSSITPLDTYQSREAERWINRVMELQQDINQQ